MKILNFIIVTMSIFVSLNVNAGTACQAYCVSSTESIALKGFTQGLTSEELFLLQEKRMVGGLNYEFSEIIKKCKSLIQNQVGSPILVQISPYTGNLIGADPSRSCYGW